MTDAINKWKAECDREVAALKTGIQEIKASQEFVSDKYDSLKSNYDSLLATSKKQEEEIQRLKAQSASLEVLGTNESKKVDALEQCGRRLNLEIAGVLEKDNENTNDIVVEIAKLGNVEITKDQISTSHRLAAKPKRNATAQAARSPPSIIVRFISRDIRNRLYANRQNLRNANSKHFSTDGTDHFYINENLTRYRKKLFWNVKTRAKSHQFKYYWTSNGNIFVKKSEETQPLLIKSDEDLALIELQLINVCLATFFQVYMTNTDSFGHAPNLNFDLNAALFYDMIDNINICNYYDPHELTHELNFSETSNLSILRINIRSLQKHINNLQEFLSNSSFFPDIIAITETRIKDQPAINIDIPGYKFFFVISFNNAGGVGVYINDTLNCRVLNRFLVDLPSCENIWLNVIMKNCKSYIVGVLYRHPFSTDVANFIDQLNQTLQDITSAGNKCVILGDFNIDILK